MVSGRTVRYENTYFLLLAADSWSGFFPAELLAVSASNGAAAKEIRAERRGRGASVEGRAAVLVASEFFDGVTKLGLARLDLVALWVSELESARIGLEPDAEAEGGRAEDDEVDRFDSRWFGSVPSMEDRANRMRHEGMSVGRWSSGNDTSGERLRAECVGLKGGYRPL